MPDSKSRIIYHFIWATKGRVPAISQEREKALFRVIGSQIERLGCHMLAINGMEDHVHLLIIGTRTASTALIMERVKGVSSRFMNTQNASEGMDVHFEWQDGYGVFSIGRNQITPVAGYIAQQKQRHASGGKALWPSWEDPND